MSRSDELRYELDKLSLSHINLIQVWLQYIILLRAVIKNNLPILNIDLKIKSIFPESKINVTYKRGKSFRGLIFPSMFPQFQVIWFVRMNLRAQLPAKCI